MRHLLPTFLFFIALACLVACGGDDPVPPTPVVPTPSDTAMVDSVLPDTTQQDSAEEDTTDVKELNLKCRDYNLDQFGYTSNVPRTVLEIIDQKGKKVSIGDVSGDGLFKITALADGYVAQSLKIRNHRMVLPFVLQPISLSGLPVKEVAGHEQDLVLSNDKANRQSANMRATILLPKGSSVRNAGDKDTVSVVAFQPAGYVFDCDHVVGDVITGAVAGVAVTPFGAQFPMGAEVCLALPMSAEGYGLRIGNVDNNDEGTLEVDGEELHFGAMYGAEWQVLMDARLVKVEMEETSLLTNQVKQSERTKSNANGRYNGYVNHPVGRLGYVAESDLNFLEERFLTSLFGSFYDKSGLAYDFYGNYPFVVEYNLKEEVYHMTFEAGGREFQAKVYGKAYIEITKATIEE